MVTHKPTYEQIIRELTRKKTLLEQAVLKELLLAPSATLELKPDDVHLFSEQNLKYIRAAVDLCDEFSIITMRSYLLSNGQWNETDEKYITHILSSDINTPISYALPELRRLHQNISVYQGKYQELINIMLNNEMPHSNDLFQTIDFTQPAQENHIQWIIPNFIPEGITILAGLGASGKTQLAIQISIHALLGIPFYRDGEKEKPINRVLYTTSEDSYQEIATRAIRYVQYLLKAKLITDKDIEMLQNRFHVVELDTPLCTVQYGGITPTPKYTQLCKTIQPDDFVVFDALSSAFLFYQNDSTQTQSVFYLLRNIHANILVLHHLNKLALSATSWESLSSSVLGSISIINRPRVVLMLWNSLLFTLKTNISQPALVWAPYEQNEKVIDTISQVINTGEDVYAVIEHEFARIIEERQEKMGKTDNSKKSNGTHYKNKKQEREVDIHDEPF